MKFVKPEMNISMFEVEDIVTGSNQTKVENKVALGAAEAEKAGKQAVTFEITF